MSTLQSLSYPTLPKFFSLNHRQLTLEAHLIPPCSSCPPRPLNFPTSLPLLMLFPLSEMPSPAASVPSDMSRPILNTASFSKCFFYPLYEMCCFSPLNPLELYTFLWSNLSLPCILMTEVIIPPGMPFISFLAHVCDPV